VDLHLDGALDLRLANHLCHGIVDLHRPRIFLGTHPCKHLGDAAADIIH